MLDPWFKKKYPLKHLKKWLYWPWAEYRVLRDAQAVLFTSEEERLAARNSFWLYKCNEKVTAYGTSDVPQNKEQLKQNFLSIFPEIKDKRVILFLGRIHEKKGCDLLIEAFAKISASDPSLHLVMAGPDQTNWSAELKARSNALGIAARVTWTGMLSGDMKWGAFYASEVFCLPSHQENFGIAVAEALACGKPVLISDKVNIWREISEDGAGWVEPDTALGTENALVKWAQASPSTVSKMGFAARECFVSRFRIERVADSLLKIIRLSVGK
jgi:glycosyltransferase involved in cell wall biosynthesis